MNGKAKKKMKIKDMPFVTVEQVLALRKAAMELEEKLEEIESKEQDRCFEDSQNEQS